MRHVRSVTVAALFAALLAVTASVAPTAHAAPSTLERPAQPLELLFDNRAVSADHDPGAADFDGAGNTLSARDLATAGWSPGQTLPFDGAPLRWPDTAPGHPDNVRADGQRVRLSGRGDAVSFLVAASSPGRPGTGARGQGTVHYRDGTTSPYTLTVPDWRNGPLATKAVALPHRNTPHGQRDEPIRLYAVTVPVDRDRTVDSVVLPRDPGPGTDLHVFSMALRAAESDFSGTWSASTAGYMAVGPWTDRTLRLVVHTSRGGPALRVRLENTFADRPLRIGSATVAVQAAGGGPTAASAPVPLTFDGRREAVLPAGTQRFSDPVTLPAGQPVPAGGNLLVSLHLPDTVTAAPVHREALQRSWVSAPDSGDVSADRDGTPYSETLDYWPFLTGVDVLGGPGSVVTLGNSLTDGVASTPGANRRWPDVLARRLRNQPPGSGVPRYGVLNHGVSANQVVSDRYQGNGVSTDTGGVSALHRLDRDVLAQTGVRTVVVFMGLNDVRWGATAQAVLDGLRTLAERSRAHGLRVLVATLTPCGGSRGCTPDVNARRTEVNDSLRRQATADHAFFDALLDFDAVLRDPLQPDRMLPGYDSGDHLHPGDAGLRALAQSVDLRLLAP